VRGRSGTTIQVTGGGSGIGISALIDGTTDICQASRSMSEDEKKQISRRYGTPVVEIPVARDGLSIYVNAGNPLNDITMDQLRLVFSGKIANWKELGGPDREIVVYSRDSNSGTHSFLKEQVLKNTDYTAQARIMPNTVALVNAVSNDKCGIGYGGAAYATGVRTLRVKKNIGSPAVAADAPQVKDGSYPLSRTLFFYVRGKSTQDVDSFLDWVLSPTGQNVVSRVGYYSGAPGILTKVGYYPIK
jgi:phosphate transport system substrate-binding protein